jgi:ATP-dependent Clp protease protease subunit
MAGFEFDANANNAVVDNVSAGLQLGAPNPYGAVQPMGIPQPSQAQQRSNQMVKDVYAQTQAQPAAPQPQALGGAEGQASDIEITAREIGKLKKELYEIIAHHSGQKMSKVEKDSDRDYWMTAAEAKEYGMVDEVLERNPRKTEAGE